MDSVCLAKNMRRSALEMIHRTHASHIASVYSAVDMVAVLYADILRYDAKNPKLDSRDRLILSKGHAGVAIYTALAHCGFFPVEDLDHYYEDGSTLSGHVSHKGVSGVEVSTGSLGHGIAMACGMALAAKSQRKNHHVYCIVGDGECEEGAVWETALIAKHHKLDNFTVLVDYNQMQAMGLCSEVAGLDCLADKWKSFGWQVIEVEDGNNHDQLRAALRHSVQDKPICIIAHTVKGKGVSFMENTLLWHYRDPQGEFYDRARMELSHDEESDH